MQSLPNALLLGHNPNARNDNPRKQPSEHSILNLTSRSFIPVRKSQIPAPERGVVAFRLSGLLAKFVERLQIFVVEVYNLEVRLEP